MTPLLLSLIQISLIMSVVAVALHLLTNLFSNSISPKWKYYIWGIVLISFLIPFRPKVLDPIVTVEAPDIGDGNVAGGQSAGTAAGATGGDNIVGPADSSFLSQIDIPTLLIGIWITGIVVFLAIVFIKHIKFMRTARRWGKAVDEPHTSDLVASTMDEMNINTHIDVIRSKMVSVPMMAGIIKPVLFLPVYDLDDEELKYVIRHELVHYRKFDIFIKLLSILANAVHWFNPLVYIMQRWIHTDCEVACDYEVTKSYEQDERVRYVETIIGVAKHEIKYKTVFSTNFYDGKKTMKKRLESVLTANKMRTALVILMVAAVVITCIAAGSALAVSTGDEDRIPYITEEKAKEIALDETGGGDIMKFTLNKQNGKRVYDVEITNGNYEYDLTIDGTSGQVTKFEKTEKKTDDSQNTQTSTENGSGNEESSHSSSGGGSGDGTGSSGSNSGNNKDNQAGTTTSKTISASKAKEIAINKVGGGKVTECKLDTDDGVKVYDVKVVYNGYEYEVEIDATTGKILDFDKEKIDDDDDDD